MTRFSPQYRLRKPAEFEAVLKRGRRQRGPLLTMSWLPNSCGHPRLGFAIARKAVPSAAARNRIKRQLREQFRLQAGELEAVDVVFFAQKPATAANRQQLREAATPLWRRIQRCAPSSSS